MVVSPPTVCTNCDSSRTDQTWLAVAVCTLLGPVPGYYMYQSFMQLSIQLDRPSFLLV